VAGGGAVAAVMCCWVHRCRTLLAHLLQRSLQIGSCQHAALRCNICSCHGMCIIYSVRQEAVVQLLITGVATNWTMKDRPVAGSSGCCSHVEDGPLAQMCLRVHSTADQPTVISRWL
jgi:hypothetical protein